MKYMFHSTTSPIRICIYGPQMSSCTMMKNIHWFYFSSSAKIIRLQSNMKLIYICLHYHNILVVDACKCHPQLNETQMQQYNFRTINTHRYVVGHMVVLPLLRWKHEIQGRCSYSTSVYTKKSSRFTLVSCVHYVHKIHEQKKTLLDMKLCYSKK